MAFCVKCGKPYEEGAAFCPGCGAQVRAGATAPAAPPEAQPPAALASPAAAPPRKRGLISSQRTMIVAIVAIVAVAAVAIAGLSFVRSVGLNGKTLVAFANHYKGTWADKDGNKAIIDTTGGVARIAIINGSDGSQLGSATIDGNTITISGSDSSSIATVKLGGNNISVDSNGGQGMQVSLSKDVLVLKDPSSGETRTFVRQ